MKVHTKIKSVFLIALIINCFVLTSALGGISFVDWLGHASLKTRIRSCPVILDLQVVSIKETGRVCTSGYRKYDDYGPYIKFKEKKLLVKCRILKVHKNISKVSLKGKTHVVLTFWKQISGPHSRNFVIGWRKPPVNNSRVKVFFMRNAFKKQFCMPTFVYKLK